MEKEADLHYLYNKEENEFIELSDGIIIGRSDDVDVVVVDENVSGKHLEIGVIDHKVSIKDLGASNGTYLNNKKIDQHRPYMLHENDEIRIGHIVLFYQTNCEREEDSIQINVGREFYLDKDPLKAISQDKLVDILDARKSELPLQAKVEKQRVIVQNVKGDILHFERKVEEREELNKKLNEFNKTHEEILEHEYVFKEIYRKHGKSWNDFNEKIVNLTRKLDEVKKAKAEIADDMLKYEEYKKLKDQKIEFLNQIKLLTRKNFPQKISDKKEELEEEEEKLKKMENELEKSERNKEKERRLERDRIKEEIKRLQNELKKV